MSDITVKYKRLHTNAKVPSYSHVGDAGMDINLPCTQPPLVPGEIRVIPCGFSVEIPSGFELQVRSRSGLSSKGIFVINAPGTLDSGFRGEVGVILCNMSGAIQPLNEGDRIAQLVLSEVPTCLWEVVDELDFTGDRGGGFGSTGV